MTPSQIVRFLGLVGLAAFLALAARTSTATQPFDDDPSLPSFAGDPRIELTSWSDDDAAAEAKPPVAPSPVLDEIVPPVAPAPEVNDDFGFGFIPPPPPTASKPEPVKEKEPAKEKDKEKAPEVAPAPAPPIVPDLTGDDFPSIDPAPTPLPAPAPEPVSLEPVKTPAPTIAEPILAPAPAPAPTSAPARGDWPKAWKAQSERSPRRAQAQADVVIEVDEVPEVVLDDPAAQARSFVERNQREAEARLKALQTEADELRGRLAKLETAIGKWQALADAMRTAQSAEAKVEAPRPDPSKRGETSAQSGAEAPTSLEPIQAPRQAVLVSEPQSARAQDVPAPPLR